MPNLLVLLCFVVAVSSQETYTLPTQCGGAWVQPSEWTMTTTRFVSVSGDDAADGRTEGTAWKTLLKAASELAPGMTLNVLNGVYTEQLVLTTSGTAASPIVIQNGDGHTAVIDGSSLTVPASDTGLVHFSGVSHVVVTGLHIRQFSTSNSDRVPCGVRIGDGCSHVGVYDNTIHDIRTTAGSGNAYGVAVFGNEATSINNIVISGNILYDLVLAYGIGIILEGNVEIFEISNNHLYNMDNIGIDVIGHYGTAPSNDMARDGVISGNLVHDISTADSIAFGGLQGDGIYVDGGMNVMIRNNVVARCDVGIEAMTEKPGGSTSGLTIMNNVVIDSTLTGIALGAVDSSWGTTSDVLVTNNTLYENGVSVYLQWHCSDIRINNNRVANARRFATVFGDSRGGDVTLANNVYYARDGNWDVSGTTWIGVADAQSNGQEIGSTEFAVVDHICDMITCESTPALSSFVPFPEGCATTASGPSTSGATTTTTSTASGSTSSASGSATGSTSTTTVTSTSATTGSTSSTTTGSSTTATSAGSSTTATSAAAGAQTPSTDDGSGDGDVSGGVVAVAVIGVIALIACVFAGFFFLRSPEKAHAISKSRSISNSKSNSKSKSKSESKSKSKSGSTSMSDSES